MERRHEEALKAVIEDLCGNSWTILEWQKIYRWFNVSKIHKRTHRLIYEMIEEICEQKGIAVKVVECSGYFLLLLGKDIKDYKEWAFEKE